MDKKPERTVHDGKTKDEVSVWELIENSEFEINGFSFTTKTYRMKTPLGWLVKTIDCFWDTGPHTQLCFVPDDTYNVGDRKLYNWDAFDFPEIAKKG